ncbi:hypothetical protein Q5H92_10370 [Hymenobacter sp. M29]|uniref:Uncharacterized protein n=1 Tax=Hymenobacter mellowenesis TaxID=3063995 RepID=A0ABT9AAA0_9BACT|nr:hypothetical protein [Hymenobacter sp. M29]MDO7846762.1 hypothetical protein [Hymenobacter sp. M29]
MLELDDLRRQWQQPAPADAPAPLDAAALTRLLARQSDGIIAKLRRSARWELGANIAILVGALAVAGSARVFWLQAAGGVLAAIGAVCIVYLYRKLHLLRRLDDPAADLRAHLLRLDGGLRALIRFYYRFTLAMLPVGGLLNVLMVVSTSKHEIRLTSGFGMALVLGLVVVLPALLYLPVASLTRKYLQRLYGQHLDRLEASLAELAEPEPVAAR